MLLQGVQALLVSAITAVICFVPYLIYQYRRYGQFSASRLIWMGALLVYGIAMLTYTLAPLPSKEWCARPHPGLIELDPTLYFRDMWQMHLAGQSWASIAASWTTVQMALNIVLFIPLGIILRHLWKLGIWRTTAIGFGLSLLIELTQLTGNWFTAACPYRVADISDLILNTIGALLGALIALLVPRLAADANAMEASRQYAKPVTRGRRWVGMICDAAIFGLVVASVAVILAGAYVLFNGAPSGDRTVAAAWGAAFRVIAQVCALAVPVGAALIGSGASLGQRLVYLKPQPRRKPARLYLVLRVLATQGVAVALLFWVPSGALWGVLLLVVAVMWVLFRVRGLSFVVTACDLVDSRPSVTE